jgi:hypothetical protein
VRLMMSCDDCCMRKTTPLPVYEAVTAQLGFSLESIVQTRVVAPWVIPKRTRHRLHRLQNTVLATAGFPRT